MMYITRIFQYEEIISLASQIKNFKVQDNISHDFKNHISQDEVMYVDYKVNKDECIILFSYAYRSIRGCWSEFSSNFDCNGKVNYTIVFVSLSDIHKRRRLTTKNYGSNNWQNQLSFSILLVVVSVKSWSIKKMRQLLNKFWVRKKYI